MQALLAGNGRSGGAEVRNKYGALLKGLLRCGTCGCGMSHPYSSKGRRRYRNYVCLRAQQRGWEACPHPSVPAGEIERFVVEQIRAVGRAPAVVAETLTQARRQADERLRELEVEVAALERRL